MLLCGTIPASGRSRFKGPAEQALRGPCNESRSVHHGLGVWSSGEVPASMGLVSAVNLPPTMQSCRRDQSHGIVHRSGRRPPAAGRRREPHAWVSESMSSRRAPTALWRDSFVRVTPRATESTHAFDPLGNRYCEIVESQSIRIHIFSKVPYTPQPCGTTTRHVTGITGGSTGRSPCRRRASLRAPVWSTRCASTSSSRGHSRTYEQDLHRSVTVREPPPQGGGSFGFRADSIHHHDKGAGDR